jgi:hypothetical protein
MRRVLVAGGISVALHAALAASVVGLAAWRGLRLARSVEVVPISVDLRELPLGAPPVPAAAPGHDDIVAPPRPRPRPRPRVKVATRDGTLPAAHPDGGADARPETQQTPAVAAARARGKAPSDLRAYGPEGSRLTALLRLDRLRASPEGRGYIGPVDEILRLLPDRRRLLEGTGLDLYRDFDALLIATPNPFDDAVTFLAARHRLDDAHLRAALDRGAVAAGRPILWREEAGRPVGVRASRPRLPEDRTPIRPDRDDRLFVMPQPGLVVIAPPAYTALLLRRASADAGAPAARADWADLVTRIDAEDGALPGDVVFMMTATNLLRTAGLRADGDGAATPVPAGVPAALPRVLSLVAGTSPGSFLELIADFSALAQASLWEAEWPSWKQRLLGNPLVLLAGLNPIVSRAELRREDRRVHLRTTATAEETRRILQMIVNFAHGGLR